MMFRSSREAGERRTRTQSRGAVENVEGQPPRLSRARAQEADSHADKRNVAGSGSHHYAPKPSNTTSEGAAFSPTLSAKVESAR